MSGDFLDRHKNKIIVLLAAFAALDVMIFWQIFGARAARSDLEIYFFDVGQGDGALAAFPGGVEILIDGGPPNGRILEGLARALQSADRYIDLVIMSHPQLDHFGGLIEVLRRYKVGALISNGVAGETEVFQEFKKVIQENGVREIVLGRGDTIRYQDSEISFLAPNEEFVRSKDINNTSLIFELRSRNSKTLFTGDIGAAVEKALSFSDIDILKVAHHGSKFSSSENFLQVVKPEVAIIGVGKNSYGHPTSQVLERLKNLNALVLRTDEDGTVKLVIDGKSVRIFKDGNIQ